MAFVQSEVASEAQREKLGGLGSLSYEPLWVIGSDGAAADVSLSELTGARIGVGPEASGTRFLALRLLAANGIGVDNATLVSDELADSIARFQQGGLDLVFAAGAPDSPALRRLVEKGGGRLLALRRTEAYARRDRAPTALTLPAGTLDLARNVPDGDLPLIAATANLVAHPSLVGLFIGIAKEVHRGGDLRAP